MSKDRSKLLSGNALRGKATVVNKPSLLSMLHSRLSALPGARMPLMRTLAVLFPKSLGYNWLSAGKWEKETWEKSEQKERESRAKVQIDRIGKVLVALAFQGGKGCQKYELFRSCSQ